MDINKDKNNKFSRIIKMTDTQLPYIEKKKFDDVWEAFDKILVPAFTNCHWGALKLFYSELEFIINVSKYIDINECLVLYVGAQPGFRLKHLFVKHFFPKMKMLLYDPLDFDIEEDEQFIIKTGAAGWFSDETIDEVLKIADGRKIIYITDIRLHEDDTYTRSVMIHEDIQKQQRWGVLMSAEFMLLKFRNFFYDNPDDVDFIDNTIPEQYGDKIIYKKDEEKHKSKNLWLLHLDGTIYSQIYGHKRSTESRLFVKKIKYYKNKNDYSKDEQEKYKMKYYNNITYDNVFNYFNIIKRNQKWEYKKSKKICKYIPGFTVSYSSASEYYIIRKYFKSQNIKPTFKKILEKILFIHTFLGNRYNNNLIICGVIRNYKHRPEAGNYFIFGYEFDKEIFVKKVKELMIKHVEMCNKQLQNLIKTKNISDKQKEEYINSIKKKMGFYYIDNNNKIILKKINYDT